MTDTANLDRIEDLVRRLERLGITPGPSPAAGPDGFPVNVAPGELIESAWGNDVVFALDAVATYYYILGQLGRVDFKIIGEINVVSTDASGNGFITFPVGQGFPTAAPAVMVQVMNPPPTNLEIGTYAITTTNFSFYATSNGVAYPNQSITLSYIAIGTR